MGSRSSTVLCHVSVSGSDRHHAATNGDRHSMCSIVRTELLRDIPHVKIDRRLRNLKLVGDLLIAITVSHQSSNIEFAGAEIFIAYVFRDFGCNFRRDVFAPCMDRPDDTQHFGFGHALEQVTKGARAQRSVYIALNVGSREHDDASVFELPSNRDKRIGSIASWQEEIHQRDVRPVLPELRDCLRGIGGLGNEQHIGLGADDGAQSLTKDGMVFNNENSYWLALSQKTSAAVCSA